MPKRQYALESAAVREFCDRLRSEAVECCDGELEVLGPRVLELRVGEPAEALHEEHHGGDTRSRHLRRVMQGPARQSVGLTGDLGHSSVGEPDQALVEEDRL